MRRSWSGRAALRPSVLATIRSGEGAGMNDWAAPPAKIPPQPPAPRAADSCAVSGRAIRKFLPAAFRDSRNTTAAIARSP